MVAALGDLTSGPVLPHMRDAMLASAEGRQILKDRPRVNTHTVDMDKLAQLPEGTWGRTYVTWLERCGVTPDTREPVRYLYLNSGPVDVSVHDYFVHYERLIMDCIRRWCQSWTHRMGISVGLPASCSDIDYLYFHQVHYVNDPELAYVMQRYRECHDFYHALCGVPVNVEYELALKFFEFANLGLPMAGLAAAFGHLRLNSAKRAKLFKEFVPWAVKCGSSAQSLITVYWEKRWEHNVEDMKKEFGIWDPPEVKWRRPLKEAQAATAKEHKRRVQLRIINPDASASVNIRCHIAGKQVAPVSE
ncbi:Ubiquinone biosynthesis protein COQ4, mitochondrial [Grifola frondosa]|uniref:4-hydroxy-3-methoxy-5-polyprenylbenzoate decarboxylase n=1 Tax=Grifola frondosa TaxID=5627 RepID=A0A1C7LNR8_GRIFR|nr:Ubiquinone biosynthesis protein COQ4, mitochondrial [Grifola frondosa]